jgi:HSP20 family protein
MSLLHHRTHTNGGTEALPTRWLPDLLTWPDLFDTGARIEEFRDGDEVVVRFEMPGLDPDEDVEVTVDHGLLRIKAERREEERDDESYRSEFRYGSYTRTIDLPAGAGEDDVKATYEDGILEVRVPVSAEQAEAKKIPVTRR